MGVLLFLILLIFLPLWIFLIWLLIQKKRGEKDVWKPVYWWIVVGLLGATVVMLVIMAVMRGLFGIVI